MKKILFLCFALSFLSTSGVFAFHSACIAWDDKSACDCRARWWVAWSPRDENIYKSCLQQVEKNHETKDSPEYKQKLLEEKQKELEAKQAELEKRQKELEAKAEAKVEKSFSSSAELAKSALGTKASIIESLVPIIKSKDSETQQKVSLILETFKASKDEYTKNVGIYLSYLLK